MSDLELCPFCGEDMRVRSGMLQCRGNFDGNKCKMNVRIPKSNDQPVGMSQSDLQSLDYYLWKRAGYDGAPPCKGEYEIRFQDGEITKADYSPDYATFYFSEDYEIHLSNVEWRDVYPESPVERAARLYFAQAKAPKRESIGFPLKTVPRDGTEILAWSVEGKNWHQVYWKKWENWQWLDKFPPRWAMRWNPEYHQVDSDYSHWMPMPANPTDIEGGE